MVKNSQKAKKTSVTSERVPISSKPSNLDCRDSGEPFDAHIVAVCKIFEKGRGFCRAPCLAVGLLYTCILQGARKAQGPCCTNPIQVRAMRAMQFFLPERQFLWLKLMMACALREWLTLPHRMTEWKKSLLWSPQLPGENLACLLTHSCWN